MTQRKMSIIQDFMGNLRHNPQSICSGLIWHWFDNFELGQNISRFCQIYLWYLFLSCQAEIVKPTGHLISVWHDIGLTIFNLVKISLDPVRSFFDISFCHGKQKMSNQLVAWHLFDMTLVWQFWTKSKYL